MLRQLHLSFVGGQSSVRMNKCTCKNARECVEGFSLWMSVAAKIFFSARTNTGLLNAITMHMQIFLDSLLHSIKSILSLVWHKRLEPQLQNPCCSSTLVSPVFFFFFCARREISQFICEPPCVYFIYSKTILTLSQISDRFAFSQSVPRFILQVGLSISILYQPQGWGRPWFPNSKWNMHRHAARHNPCLFDFFTCCTAFARSRLSHGDSTGAKLTVAMRSFAFHSILISFFIYVFGLTVKSICLQPPPDSFSYGELCTSATEKAEHPFWTNVLWTSWGKQIPSLKEAYYLVQLKIY